TCNEWLRLQAGAALRPPRAAAMLGGDLPPPPETPDGSLRTDTEPASPAEVGTLPGAAVAPARRTGMLARHALSRRGLPARRAGRADRERRHRPGGVPL